MALKNNVSIIITIIFCIYAVDQVRCACDSNTLRDYAVEACNHITKRSVDLNNFYTVEHIYPKNSINHRHALARKLTHRDFPKGAYLLVKPHKRIYDNTINEDSEEMPNNTKNGLENEILTEDMQGRQNHKNKHSYRFRRTTSEFIVEHCCSKVNIDICGRYFCH